MRDGAFGIWSGCAPNSSKALCRRTVGMPGGQGLYHCLGQGFDTEEWRELVAVYTADKGAGDRGACRKWGVTSALSLVVGRAFILSRVTVTLHPIAHSRPGPGP